MGKLIKKKIKTTHIYNGTTFNFRISGATNSHLLSLLSSLNFIHQFDHHSKNPETEWTHKKNCNKKNKIKK